MIQIRYAGERDIENIVSLLKALELFHPGFLLEKVIVAENAGSLIGIAHIRAISGFNELTHVGVLPAFRKQGIAKKLIERLLHDTTGHVYLNTVVPDFFSRIGFQKTTDFPTQFNKPEGWCTGCTHTACTSMVSRGAL